MGAHILHPEASFQNFLQLIDIISWIGRKENTLIYMVGYADWTDSHNIAGGWREIPETSVMAAAQGKYYVEDDKTVRVLTDFDTKVTTKG